MITTDTGAQVQAAAPVILSASRSTDIPAFYAGWFFNRLKKGYCVWYNPFNRQKMYISFRNCKVIVFWTKNPEPILPYLHELEERGIHYYFQVTLNDYEQEQLEPNVPPLAQRIASFKRLANRIGHERVIWRFDPLLLTPDMTPSVLLHRIGKIGNLLKGHTDKLVFSFADIINYRKVQRNLLKETDFFTAENLSSAEMTPAQRQEIVEGLVRLRERWATEGWQLTLATCAEEMELEAYGIAHNRCIDGELMKRLFAADSDLLYYLNTGHLPECDSSGHPIPHKPQAAKAMKDKGQRKACGCMISKDIGSYNTCRHFCLYCYANHSKAEVERRTGTFTEENESLSE